MVSKQGESLNVQRSVDHNKVLGVLLAGGAGKRFAGPNHKLLVPFRGRPIYQWALDAILEAGLPAAIVWGAVDDEPPVPAGVTVLHNPRWSAGMATTLQVGIQYAREFGATAVITGPADQPLIPASAWHRLAATDAAIAVATYDGRRANPVRLSAEVWPLLPETGDIGARDLIRLRPDLVTEVACSGNPADIDTREDYERWN